MSNNISDIRGKISIIVPVYNAENYLCRCLDSLISQTYNNIEIILIDDGSTDRSLEICNYYKKKDKRIIVLIQENKGASVARNLGKKNATGEFIGFVDSDDYVDPNMYEMLMKVIIETDSDVVDCGEVVFYNDRSLDYYKSKFNNLNIKIDTIIENDIRKMYWLFYNMKVCNWRVCTKLFRKSIIDDVDFYGYNAEDTRFILEIISKNCKFVSIENKLYYYFKGNENSFTRKFTEKTLDIFELYLMFQKCFENNNMYEEAHICEAKYYTLIVNFYARVYFSKILDKDKYLDNYYRIINENIKSINNNNKVSVLYKININIFTKFPKFISYINIILLKMFDLKRYLNENRYKRIERNKYV